MSDEEIMTKAVTDLLLRYNFIADTENQLTLADLRGDSPKDKLLDLIDYVNR